MVGLVLASVLAKEVFCHGRLAQASFRLECIFYLKVRAKAEQRDTLISDKLATSIDHLLCQHPKEL